MNIEVILTQDDPKLGKRGQKVKVSPGFANNFLLPNGKAVHATAASLKSFGEENARRQRRQDEEKAKAQALGERLSKSALKIEMPAGEGGKLYGAVTTKEIAHQLSQAGLSVDKKDIHLEEPLKKLGSYKISAKLHPAVTVSFSVEVVKKP